MFAAGASKNCQTTSRSPPANLRIEFRGGEDLAAKVVELSQAMANDWSAFLRAVEEP